MGDKLNRIELDRKLFERDARAQLEDTISKADPRLVAGAIAKAVELQIVTEDIAHESGVDTGEQPMREYIARNRADVDEQVNRALTAFICSIVSAEG